jgi:hypothetical protein
MPRQKKREAMRKTSRILVLTTRWSTRGMRKRAPTKTAAIVAALNRKREAMAAGDADRTLARTGTRAIIGTMAMSWKIRMPKATCPWGAADSPRSEWILRTTAVLLRETRKP